MIIDTHSKESILLSLSTELSVSSDEFEYFLFLNRYVLYKDGDFCLSLFVELFQNYFHNSANIKLIIDEILLFHLSRRLFSDDSVIGENLYTLLTTENALSSFLFDHEIKFYPDGEALDLVYKGKYMPLEKSPQDIPGPTTAYLWRRLGHSSIIDFCFNGFAFRDQLAKNDYWLNLFNGPEFLQALERYLRCRNLVSDFFINSQYYCFEYKLPLEQIVFDEAAAFSAAAKSEYLIVKVFNRIHEYLTNQERYIFDDDNPIIRLAEAGTMHSQYFIQKEEITESMLGRGA